MCWRASRRDRTWRSTLSTRRRASIISGQRVRIRNDRGAFLADAVVTERARPGVVVAPSPWWSALTPDGRNVNHTTSQALTDIGGGATFYDNLVEVEGAS